MDQPRLPYPVLCRETRPVSTSRPPWVTRQGTQGSACRGEEVFPGGDLDVPRGAAGSHGRRLLKSRGAPVRVSAVEAAPAHVPGSSGRGVFPSAASPALTTPLLCWYHPLRRPRGGSHRGLHSLLPRAGEAERVSICLLAVCTSSRERGPQAFCPHLTAFVSSVFGAFTPRQSCRPQAPPPTRSVPCVPVTVSSGGGSFSGPFLEFCFHFPGLWGQVYNIPSKTKAHKFATYVPSLQWIVLGLTFRPSVYLTLIFVRGDKEPAVPFSSCDIPVSPALSAEDALCRL